ncbi:hypothetical protein HY837_04445 [archaeon]|nr:hypothetical protein [archaeon]
MYDLFCTASLQFILKEYYGYYLNVLFLNRNLYKTLYYLKVTTFWIPMLKEYLSQNRIVKKIDSLEKLGNLVYTGNNLEAGISLPSGSFPLILIKHVIFGLNLKDLLMREGVSLIDLIVISDQSRQRLEGKPEISFIPMTVKELREAKSKSFREEDSEQYLRTLKDLAFGSYEEFLYKPLRQ